MADKLNPSPKIPSGKKPALSPNPNSHDEFLDGEHATPVKVVTPPTKQIKVVKEDVVFKGEVLFRGAVNGLNNQVALSRLYNEGESFTIEKLLSGKYTALLFPIEGNRYVKCVVDRVVEDSNTSGDYEIWVEPITFNTPTDLHDLTSFKVHTLYGGYYDASEEEITFNAVYVYYDSDNSALALAQDTGTYDVAQVKLI